MTNVLDRTVARVRSDGRMTWGRITASSRALPDFVVIGVQRAGTTSLFRDLRQHPQVVGAVTKEVHYFDFNHSKGPGWYRAHFPTERSLRATMPTPVTGEATPNYLFHPHAPFWLAAELPEARLVVVLRDPVSRAWSHWKLNRRIGLEELGFDEALDREEERTTPDRARLERDPEFAAHDLFRYSYTARGIYADQLELWFSAIPRDRFLIVDSEVMGDDAEATFATVTDFIGVTRWSPPAYSRAHGSSGSSLADTTRERLEAFYAPHRRKLADLLGG